MDEDEDEASFADAAARLGVDAFNVPDKVENLILQAAASLPSSVLEDFFDAVDLSTFDQTLSRLLG